MLQPQILKSTNLDVSVLPRRQCPYLLITNDLHVCFLFNKEEVIRVDLLHS